MQSRSVTLPEHLLHPLTPFAADFERQVKVGERALADASVVFVGLARNCDRWLAGNLGRLRRLTANCRAWRLHIETNDNADATDQVLVDFCAASPQATFTSQRLNRQQYTSEFAGPRTKALAEYRTVCQSWVRDNARYADYVVVVDWDAWGGWSHAGFLHGLGRLLTTPDAAGMASVSLFQHDFGSGPQWVHYDCWALRLNTPWDDYTAGCGGWKYGWLPPVGSPPVRVCSAFGGMAIYRTSAYLAGKYDGETDCEHVTFHRSIHEATRQHLYLCPSMRMVMSWLEQSSNGGQHLND
jgi:hypothetical protein